MMKYQDRQTVNVRIDFSPKTRGGRGTTKPLTTSRFSEDVRKLLHTSEIHLRVSSKIETVHIFL